MTTQHDVDLDGIERIDIPAIVAAIQRDELWPTWGEYVSMPMNDPAPPCGCAIGMTALLHDLAAHLDPIYLAPTERDKRQWRVSGPAVYGYLHELGYHPTYLHGLDSGWETAAAFLPYTAEEIASAWPDGIDKGGDKRCLFTSERGVQVEGHEACFAAPNRPIWIAGVQDGIALVRAVREAGYSMRDVQFVDGARRVQLNSYQPPIPEVPVVS